MAPEPADRDHPGAATLFPLTAALSSCGEDWTADALCAQTDPDAFFPDQGGSAAPAKAVCRLCAVRTYCLDYALAHDERFGVWGGLSEAQRRRLRRSTPTHTRRSA